MVNPYLATIGGMVGESLVGYLTPGVPGYDVRYGDIMPGGAPFVSREVPGVPEAAVVNRWVANGVVFNQLWDGKIACQKKNGVWRVWRPKSQTLTARLNRECNRALKLKRIQKKLNKVFPRGKR